METTKNTVKVAKLSNRLATKLAKVENFNLPESNNFQKLLHVANVTEVEMFGLSKALKMYIKNAKGVLTPNQLKVLTFENVLEFVQNSPKYNGLPLFSLHQITLISNAVIKENDRATKLAARAEKQGAIVGKKADKVTANVAVTAA
jgi:hypothetical protein